MSTVDVVKSIFDEIEAENPDWIQTGYIQPPTASLDGCMYPV